MVTYIHQRRRLDGSGWPIVPAMHLFNYIYIYIYRERERERERERILVNFTRLTWYGDHKYDAYSIIGKQYTLKNPKE